MNENEIKDQIDHKVDIGHRNEGFEIDHRDISKMDTMNNVNENNPRDMESHKEHQEGKGNLPCKDIIFRVI